MLVHGTLQNFLVFKVWCNVVSVGVQEGTEVKIKIF